MADSNYDVMAGMQDILGYQGLVGQNPYLTYQGAIPFGNNYQTVNPYTGQTQAPTNAYGRAIQPPQGTTLTSNPVQQTPAATPAATASAPDNSALINYLQSQNQTLEGMPSSLNPGGWGSGGNVYNNSALAQIQNNAQQIAMLQQAAAMAAAQPAATQPTASTQASGTSSGQPLSNSQYLSLLANPGPLQSVGAAPPGPGQTATGSAASTPNVMSAFLAANKSGNTPFLNTLRTMQNQGAGGLG